MAKIETPQPVRGTQSLLGEEADRFHAVIAAFDRVRQLFGFKRVEVPVIEPTAKQAITTTTHIAIARHGWVALQRAARTVICPLAIPTLPLCAPSGAPPSAPWRHAGYGQKPRCPGHPAAMQETPEVSLG